MVARGQHTLVLVFLMLAGALMGSIVSEALAHTLWIFSRSAEAGLHPSTLNLLFVNVTFGFQLRLSLGTVLGVVAAFILYRRL